MQPIIYNSLDTGAPQLSLTAGALNTVIKSCLVTGYGSKAGAGWEIAHEDAANYKLAIRSKNQKSIKSVLLLSNTENTHANVAAYTGWDSGLKTGTGVFGQGVFVNNWADDNPSWIMLATDRFFYFFVRSEASNKTMRVFTAFGDVELLSLDQEGCAILIASEDTPYAPPYTGHKALATSMGVVANFPDSVFPKLDISYGWGDRAASGYRSSLAVLGKFPMYMLRDSVNKPSILLPGMLMPYSEITGFTTKDDIDRLENQHPYINPVFGMYQPYHGRVWIHTDDWG